MRISYNWLKDYVDIKMPPEKLAELLTMAGLCVDSIHKKRDDSVLEIEITSNRPDWLSYIGIAREIGALTGKKLKSPYSVQRTAYSVRRSTPALPAGRHNAARSTVSVKVEDKKLCPRYTARVIRNVKVGESPKWLKDKLEAVGLRSVNNIVDITNFCLLETGEPMHAFDLDKLKTRSIIARKASKGEKIRTIDGSERTLDNDMLVIADDKSPVAIAGVMGSLYAEVSTRTKDILLEAAYFDPISVRRTSRKLALSTDSSYRFERKVDIENIEHASGRAARLIVELAGGEAGEFIDIGKMAPAFRKIGLRLDRLNKIIGVEISPSRVKSILVSLGLKVKCQSKNVLELKPPGFRSDLQNEIDMIEEVARIYGYGNIPETIPPVLEAGNRLSPGAAIDRSMRGILVNLGLSEIITYSLLSRKTLGLAKLPDDNVIAIKNPLSSEQEIMRPSAIPGMLNAIRYNINRRLKDLRLFELGKVYFKESANTFGEKRDLSIGITGQVHDGWAGKSRDIGLFDLKGIVETLFLQLGIGGFSIRQVKNDIYSPGICASIEIRGEPLGVIGGIDPGVLKNFDIKDKVYIAELDCGALFKFVSLKKYFKEPPRYPSISRDISIVTGGDITNELIMSTIKEAAGGLLKNIQLIDRYRGGQIPDGKTSLTYRLEYQDFEKTLEDKDISEIHSRVVRALKDNLGAGLR